MTGYDPSKHDRWLDPPDFSSVDECKVCGSRRDVGDMEQWDGGYVCCECLPEYEPLCDECGKRFPLAQMVKVERPWCTYQFCTECAKGLGYAEDTQTKEGEE